MWSCFLCDPDADLVYVSNDAGAALCGLGPVVTGYSVVSTKAHIRSAADAAAGEAPGFAAFASAVRARLSSQFGSCLLTEHGRVPACFDVSRTADPHCYHAHFLLFPAAPPLEPKARTYFARAQQASSLDVALELAASHAEYFLFSQDPSSFLVLTRPGRLIRQFARMLVAESLGRPELANWRRHSMRREAVDTAARLRPLFRSWGPS
jgi:hypothetical protein